LGSCGQRDLAATPIEHAGGSCEILMISGSVSSARVASDMARTSLPATRGGREAFLHHAPGVAWSSAGVQACAGRTQRRMPGKIELGVEAEDPYAVIGITASRWQNECAFRKVRLKAFVLSCTRRVSTLERRKIHQLYSRFDFFIVL